MTRKGLSYLWLIAISVLLVNSSTTPLLAQPVLPREITGADQEPYTHLLTQSTASTQVWTAPPSRRIFRDDTLPTLSAAEIRVYAAANEVEPFQVIVKPTVTAFRTQVMPIGSTWTRSNNTLSTTASRQRARFGPAG